MKVGALVGAAICFVLSCILGGMVLLDGTPRWRWFAGPGEVFAFLFLKGDNYRSYPDMLRHAIPATIAMYTLSGAIAGGGIAMFVRLCRKRSPRATDAF